MKSTFKCGVRSAECGMRNTGRTDGQTAEAPSGSSPIPHSAFRIPHWERSAFRIPRRGAALVEFSLVMPLLMLLLLGVMEFGMIMHDFLTIAHSVREGVRSAAIGNSADQVRQQVERASLTGLKDDMIHIRYEDKNGNWTEVTGNPAGAAVPSDAHFAEVSVVGYPHKMVTGSFFAWLPGVQNNTLYLRSKMVMRRE